MGEGFSAYTEIAAETKYPGNDHQCDNEIDQYEIEVEEECLKTLALYQPVAIDLRFLVAVLKITNDLERIGDLATNIAQRTGNLIEHRMVCVPFDLDSMLVKTMAMVKGSADALVARDPALANDPNLYYMDAVELQLLLGALQEPRA